MMSFTPGAGELILVNVTGDSGVLDDALRRELCRAGWRVSRLLGLADAADEERIDAKLDAVFGTMDTPAALVMVVDVGQHVPFVDGGVQEWEAPLTACLRVPFLVLRRALDEFIAGGAGGRVVVVIVCPTTPATIPATLRAGLASLSNAVATEYGRRGIACNAIVVPHDAGDITGGIVEMARFLVSENAGYLTGEVIDLTASS